MTKKFEVWQPAVGCEGINFDGFTDPDELWKFHNDARGVRPITMAKTLFPSQPKGYVAATVNLRCYAANKATAMTLRARGKIETAMRYEGICDRIYQQLPEYARW